MSNHPSAGFLAHQSEDKSRVQTVLEHLEGTAALAEQFARPFGGGEQARLAGMLHDIGKYSEAFQARLQGSRSTVDHSTAGAQEAFRLRQPEAAFAIAGHHSGLPDGGASTDRGETPTLFGRLKKKVEPYGAWSQELQPGLSGAKRPAQIAPDNLSEAFYTRMLYSCLVDADFLDTEAFMREDAVPRGGYAPLSELLQKLRQYIAPWLSPSNALNRKRCAVHCVALTASEAALRQRLEADIAAGRRTADVIPRSLARLPLYTALSARNIDTTGKTPAEVAAEIAQFGQTP